MNLAVDIGNTSVKAAVFDAGSNAVQTVRIQADAENILRGLCSRYGVGRAIVCSTACDDRSIADALRADVGYVLDFRSGCPVPIGNDYATPETLGADRIAAAVGADALYGGDMLIVDFGTAVTFDLVSGGVFRGGNISPGVQTRFRALHDYTARLPLATPDAASAGRMGASTVEAIANGVLDGVTYEVEGYIASLREKYADLSVIFTGGDAKLFEKRIKNAIFANRDLVLFGLNRILEYDCGREHV